MGVVTSLFGGVVGPVLPALEKVFGVMVIAFGLLLLADVNLFKRFTWVHRIQAGGTRALVRAPPRPQPRARLDPLRRPHALGRARARRLEGVDGDRASRLLLVYSLGFAVPMLAVGYGSQALRQRVRLVSAHPVAVRWVSGLLLVAFGGVILTQGMLFAGM